MRPASPRNQHVFESRAATSGSARLANLALVLVFTALSLALAEWAFRSLEQGWLRPELPAAGGSGAIDLRRLRYNDTVVQRRTGAQDFRILSFGDSFTYSVMEPELSYGGVLQERLQEWLPQRRVRVVNLGEPATGTRHFRESHDFWSERLDHQAVLFHIFLGNDILDDAYLYTPLVWSPNIGIIEERHPVLAEGNPRIPRKYPLRMLDYLWAWWMSGRTRSEDPLPAGYNWAARTDFAEDDFLRINGQHLENFDPERLPALLPGYEEVLRLLARAQSITEAGMPAAVVLGPAQPQVEDDLRQRVLSRAGREESAFDLGLPARIIRRMRDRVAPDVLLLDLTLPFRDRTAAEGDSLYFRRNTHWNRAGNRLAGESLAAALGRHWFGLETVVDPGLWRHPRRNVLMDEAAIDRFLRPLFERRAGDAPAVTGALRAIQLFDGVTDDPENWAIAPLGEPVVVTLPEARTLSSLRLHLAEPGRRSYRLTVEILREGGWILVADHSLEPVSGRLDVPLGDDGRAAAVSALRIIGLDHSGLAADPGNRFLHLRELELLP